MNDLPTRSNDRPLGQLVASLTQRLSAAGSDTGRLDAELLIAHALGVSRTWVLAHDDHDPDEEQRRAIELLAQRREANEPIAYIIGRQGFRNVDLLVDSRVLIPRPETEFVVQSVLDEVDRLGVDRHPVNIVDVGTGSGAIAIAVADEAPIGAVEVLATDLSDDALTVAASNG